MAAWPSHSPAAKISATTTGGVLAITFDRKSDHRAAAIAAAMPRLIASGRADADGKTLRFTLTQPIKLHVSQLGTRAVVDVAPMRISPAPCRTWCRRPSRAPKPLDIAGLPEIKLRTGAYEKFTRLVFDWPQGCLLSGVSRRGQNDIRFHAPAREPMCR